MDKDMTYTISIFEASFILFLFLTDVTVFSRRAQHTVQIMVLNRKSNMAQFRLHSLHSLHCLYVYNSLLKGF